VAAEKLPAAQLVQPVLPLLTAYEPGGQAEHNFAPETLE